MRLSHILPALGALLLLGSAPAARPVQAELDRMAQDLRLTFSVDDNRATGCGSASGCFHATLQLDSPVDLKGGWALYFNLDAAIEKLDTDEVSVRHVNGDLYVLEPTASFRGFGGNRRLAIGMRGAGALLSRYFFYPNAYLAVPGLAPRVIASTRPLRDPETGLATNSFVEPFRDPARLAGRSAEDISTWPTAASLYEANGGAPGAAPAIKLAVLPTPSSVQLDPGRRRVALARGIAVSLSGIPAESVEVALRNLVAHGVSRQSGGLTMRIRLAPETGATAGAYKLAIAADGLTIAAPLWR